jgi:hypothetical protein
MGGAGTIMGAGAGLGVGATTGAGGAGGVGGTWAPATAGIAAHAAIVTTPNIWVGLIMVCVLY